MVGLYGMVNAIIPINSLLRPLTASLKKNIFENYNQVSAILISAACENRVMTFGEEQLYNDMVLIHNPWAINKLPLNIINARKELCPDHQKN